MTIHQLIQQSNDIPKIVRFTRASIVIPGNYPRDIEDAVAQRTLRGRIVGIPTFAPCPTDGAKRYLMVRLATRRHGVLTLPLPPSAAEELARLESDLGSIKGIDLVVSMVIRRNDSYVTFADGRRRAA